MLLPASGTAFLCRQPPAAPLLGPALPSVTAEWAAQGTCLGSLGSLRSWEAPSPGLWSHDCSHQTEGRPGSEGVRSHWGPELWGLMGVVGLEESLLAAELHGPVSV